MRSASLLTQQDFEQLLVSPSAQTSLRVLENTRYYFKADDLNDLDKIEERLTDNLVENYRFAISEGPNRSIVEVFGAKYIYHNLKVIFKNLVLNQDNEDLLITIGRFSIDELYHIIQTSESSVIPNQIIERVKQIRADYDTYQDIKVVNLGLDMAYFDHLDDIRKKEENPIVDAVITALIDFYNVITVYRGTQLGKPRSFMFEMLSDKGTVAISDLLQMISDNQLASWFESINQLPYVKTFDAYIEKMNEGTIQAYDLERMETEYIYQLLKEELLNPNDVVPLLFYLYRKEMEITNLRLILNGRVSGLPIEKIKERMRPVYE